MKIEIGESLCYSYLRHVQRCWLVQPNWKVSSHWERVKTDDQLQELFDHMRSRFGEETFKQTTKVEQFLKQSEVDLIGIDLGRNIHAMEIAFHEAGLHYGDPDTVLKKMLRALLTLRAYHSDEVKLHIYFATPKAHPKPYNRLVTTFTRLSEEYSDSNVEWRLLANEKFTEEIVQATLAKTDTEADTTELFARAAKLLKLTGFKDARQSTPTATVDGHDGSPKLQQIVRILMRTLLVDAPKLLGEEDVHGLMDTAYCKTELGIIIGNLALIRERKCGRLVSGKSRYYAERYGGYYVCSQWNKKYHVSNARALLCFVRGLASKRDDHPDVNELEQHERALDEFVRHSSIGS